MSPAARPSVGLTAWRSVGLAALVGAAATGALYFVLDRLSLPLPVPPLLGAGVIAIVAGIVGWQSYLTWRAIHRRRRPVQPRTAVALLALGKTALLAGAALAGGYAAIALHALTFLEAELPRARAIGAAWSLVASVGLAVAGRRLERACELPPEDPDATPDPEPDDRGQPG